MAGRLMSSPLPTHRANPASAFYANGLARSVGVALRLAQSVAPAAASRLALRLFFTPLPLKLAARRRQLPAPWRVERWSFEHGSVAVYRRNEESAAERPTVLLVHGWAGDAQQMRTLADALDAAGLNPVLLDFPAHGRSEGWRASLPQFVRALWAASARLGPLHAVVAHSLGALAAAHAAANGLPAAAGPARTFATAGVVSSVVRAQLAPARQHFSAHGCGDRAGRGRAAGSIRAGMAGAAFGAADTGGA
jgi:alpha-beta hydrolase superfamily lysophospholipase